MWKNNLTPRRHFEALEVRHESKTYLRLLFQGPLDWLDLLGGPLPTTPLLGFRLMCYEFR
jgi:hypothetical protein